MGVSLLSTISVINNNPNNPNNIPFLNYNHPPFLTLNTRTEDISTNQLTPMNINGNTLTNTE